MGSGKSHLGGLLAEKLNYSFLDMDTYIEETEGKTIANIIASEGMDAFRSIEHKSLLNILNKRENLVVATGGGTPCFHRNMEWINQNGISIFLNAPVKLLYSRLEKETEKRPIIKGLSGQLLEDKIKDLRSKRQLKYEQAKLKIDQYQGQSASEALDSMHQLLLPFLT